MFDSQKDLHKKLLGRSGEKQALKHLKKEGYRIFETNCKTPYGEADIVAARGGLLVLCEVKTRTDDRYGLPREAVDKKKQERYYRMGEYLLLKKEFRDMTVRFDVIEILNGSLEHLEGAF